MQKRVKLTTALAVVPVAALVAVTSACSSGTSLNGEQKKKPDQVITDAKNALEAAKTVHMVGSITDSEDGDKQTLGIDLRFLKGTGVVGSLTSSGRKIELIRVGNDVYVKGGTGLFGSAASAANGRYVKVSATSDQGKEIGDITDLNAFADDTLAPDDTLKSTLEKGKVDGKKAVILTSNGSDGAAKLYIANTGDPVPLRFTGSGSDSGELRFIDYGKNVTITAPTNSFPLPSS